MDERKKLRESVTELMDNLSTIGLFMLGEVRSTLNRSWGSSREEFMAAVDRVAKNMKESGKMATEDVERAANEIKNNWKLLDEQSTQEWETFRVELKNRLDSIGDLSREAFDLSVEQAKKTLDAQWTATGRIGEEQLKLVEQQTERMAQQFKGQWTTFRDQMEKSGRKVDRALKAALDELKKEQ